MTAVTWDGMHENRFDDWGLVERDLQIASLVANHIVKHTGNTGLA